MSRFEQDAPSVSLASIYADLLPWPAQDANKYTRGKLVVVAGSDRYPGAAALAACASQRMGAGYTEVVTAPESVNIVRLWSPSLVVRSFDDWKPADLPVFSEEKPCAVCIGPGFVPDDEKASNLVVRVLRKAECPVLVDGGGLSCLTSKRGLRALADRADRGFVTVVTPHGGEAARLACALDIALDESPRLSADLATSLNAIVVLKGPDTYVSEGGEAHMVTDGTPALSKAGTGDVLAGMISSLLAQGLDALDACLLGVRLHARAGMLAANELTEIAVMAEDVIEWIPAALR